MQNSFSHTEPQKSLFCLWVRGNTIPRCIPVGVILQTPNFLACLKKIKNSCWTSSLFLYFGIAPWLCLCVNVKQIFIWRVITLQKQGTGSKKWKLLPSLLLLQRHRPGLCHVLPLNRTKDRKTNKIRCTVNVSCLAAHMHGRISIPFQPWRTSWDLILHMASNHHKVAFPSTVLPSQPLLLFLRPRPM